MVPGIPTIFSITHSELLLLYVFRYLSINENVFEQFKTVESKRNNVIIQGEMGSIHGVRCRKIEKNLLIFTLDFGLYF